MSIRTRLLAGILLLLTLALAGTDAALYVRFQRYLETHETLDLETARDWVRVSLPTRQPIPDEPNAALFGYPALVGEILLLDPNGKPLGVIRPGRDFAVADKSAMAPLVADLPVWESTAETGGRSYRVLYERSAPPQYPWLGGYVIAVDRDMSHRKLRQFLLTELAASGAALVAVGALSLLVIQVGLRPVRAIAGAAASVAAGDRSQRIPEPRRQDEIGRLAVVLNQAFDQRKTAEEQLRRFVADASHELRTPLTTIRGWADLYFQDGLPRPDGVDTAMTRIAEKSAEVSVLVEDLLLLARLDERRPVTRTPVDVAALAADVCADARVLDPDRPLTLDAPGSAIVEGDPDQLRQVVRNLVGNAFQHTPPGTAVRVAVRTTSDGVVVTVADDGPGVPDEDRDHVFERFYRAGTTTAPRVGAGLGLAITRAIVEAHGGTVTLEPGPGARFTVTIP